MGYEHPLPEGHHYLFLRCQNCGIKKRLAVPAYPLPIGSILPTQGWGQDACCIKCGCARLEVLNEPPKPPPPPPPQGFVKKPG